MRGKVEKRFLSGLFHLPKPIAKSEGQPQLFILCQRLAVGYRRPESVKGRQHLLNSADITKHITEDVPIDLDDFTKFPKVCEIYEVC